VSTYNIDAIVSVEFVMAVDGGEFVNGSLDGLSGAIWDNIETGFTPRITFTVEAENEEEAQEKAEAGLKQLRFEAWPDITWTVAGGEISAAWEES
jgi:hypothetical protein